MTRTLRLLMLVVVGCAVIPASAAVPKYINFQGRITNAGGTPVADGPHTITFRIWSDSSGGAILWSETQAVTTISGLFSATLGISAGNQIPDTIFLEHQPPISAWLGCQLAPDPEMAPRQQLVSVGYAYRSEHVTSVDGATGGSINGSLSFGNATNPMLYIYESGTANPDRPVISHSPAFPDWGLAYNDVNDKMYFQGNGAKSVTVDLGLGRLGVGTTSPLYRLDVADSSGGAAARFLNKDLNGAGVAAYNNWFGNGVYGQASLGYGVEGVATSGSGVGVHAKGGQYGIYAEGTSYAGVFSGNVTVIGTLSKLAGSFKIDHPLDPANKYLSHSFVESPDMKNIYDGVITLDASGAAVVTLPDWFGALNQDFRYQLTAIGAPGPNLYIASEINDNHFRIAGGAPGMKVSWMVTGIRHDAYAQAHRIPVEEEKAAEDRGKYLSPDLFGQSQERGIFWKKPPTAIEQQPEK